jgi:2-keto-4-pentenoate hydratase/2-oxohepta-3-ene-1,7-dioic acid hydratase in catechol pathway
MVGKTLDGFAPIGPYFVSADQVDPNNLNLETRVNGEVRQSVNTTKFIFNPQKLIAYTSRLFALEPGDIIFTGTPSGERTSPATGLCVDPAPVLIAVEGEVAKVLVVSGFDHSDPDAIDDGAVQPDAV